MSNIIRKARQPRNIEYVGGEFVKSFVASFRVESGELVILEYPSRIARFLDLGASGYWSRVRLSTRVIVRPSK